MSSSSLTMKLWHVIILSFLAQVYIHASTAKPSISSSLEKSGRQAVCLHETVMYRCLTSYTLTWNIHHPGRIESIIFFAGDNTQFVDQGQYFARLEDNSTMNLLSQLVIPYVPEWNRIRIECMSGSNGSESLFYITAGLPSPPSSIQRTVTDHYINLHWNTTCDVADCSMVMITVDNNIMLNTSYQMGAAVIDISEYLSKDSIEIKTYGVDQCGTRSDQYYVETVKLPGKENGTSCLGYTDSEVGYIALAVGGPAFAIALFFGACFGFGTHKYCYSSNAKNSGISKIATPI